MTIRFYNARILTMESDRIISGELWTDGSRISYVGTADDVPAQKNVFDRQIDCMNNLLYAGIQELPHSYSDGFRKVSCR